MKKSKIQLKRTNIYLTETQIQKLTKLQEDLGVPSAEIIRRAIDNYLNENNTEIVKNTIQRILSQINKSKMDEFFKIFQEEIEKEGK